MTNLVGMRICVKDSGSSLRFQSHCLLTNPSDTAEEFYLKLIVIMFRMQE